MKDYLLSEMKKICKNNYHGNGCGECELFSFCSNNFDFLPIQWQVEPRDMIELPCKMEYEGKYGKCWKVYYRNVLDGTIVNKGFYDKTQADEFLKELQNGKV